MMNFDTGATAAAVLHCGVSAPMANTSTTIYPKPNLQNNPILFPVKPRQLAIKLGFYDKKFIAMPCLSLGKQNI
jgi:hypothetical protein